MIRRILSRLYRSSPEEIIQSIGRRLNRRGVTPVDRGVEAVVSELAERFSVYRVGNLRGIAADEFRHLIESRIGTIDALGEGYQEDERERQRDLSIKFCWGHTHDFGAFKVEGRMADRHIRLLANFINLFPVTQENFAGKNVLDVGCWTGGTTLLLAALGARVHAIEEVKKYAETTAFLARVFGIDNRVVVESLSLYDCNRERFADRFEVVYFPGVIYHLSDPLIGLRILFNSLKVGGIILVESAGINHDMPYCRFDGSNIHLSGSKEELNRGGWNWFMPSPSALARLLREAGFEEIDTRWHAPTERVFGFARKRSQVGICKAGLSVPNIR